VRALNHLSRWLTAIFTDPVDLEIVPRGIKAILAADLLFNLCHFRREEFNRAAAFGANHVMMAAAVKLVFKAGGPIRKRHHAGQTAFGKQLERPIHSGKADLRVLFSHQAEEFVSRKMVARLQERAQNRISLVSVLQSNALQMAIENVLSFAHGFTRWWSMVVNPSLQHLHPGPSENPK